MNPNPQPRPPSQPRPPFAAPTTFATAFAHSSLDAFRIALEALKRGDAVARKLPRGYEPEKPSGHYDFKPGKEMQHDTSPHVAEIRRRKTPVVTLVYVGGVCEDCMIDNTHVVVLSGTGRDMVPVPEMAAFAERFGFQFDRGDKQTVP